MRLLLLGTDEGLLVSGAVRVAYGQVFARDFFEIVGPGTFYWLALFFKLFGVTFLAERICLFVTSIGTGLLMYFLSRRICGRYSILPCVLLAGTSFGMVWPTISHHVDSNFFALLAVACTILWQDKRKNVLLLGAGTFAAITTCVHQPKGILLLCALIAWLCIQYRRRETPMSSMGYLSGSYIGAIGLVIAYFWSRHALWDVINANYLWPSAHYGPANVVSYAQGIFVQYWAIWAGPAGRVNWTAATAALLVVPFLFIAVLPALLLVLGAWHRNEFPKAKVLLFWLCGCALWLAEIHRKDIQHLVFGSPLLIILCVYYLEQYRTRIAGVTLQVVSICAACLACFNLFLVLTAHPMATRVGSVVVFKTDPVLTFLDEHVLPGQEIFVYPYSPMYYFLSGTTNPTRWSGLGYGYNSPSDFQEVIRVLDQHRVKYVIWDTLVADNARRFSPSLYRPRPDEQIAEPYFESHYTNLWEQNGVRIMERIER
jgi:hypothetical protein